MNLGSILKEQGLLEQAREATLKAIELQPDYPDAHVNLGLILKDQGLLDQAREALLEAIELQPGNVIAHMNFACIEENLGNLESALRYYKTIFTMNGSAMEGVNTTSLICSILILIQLDQLEEARESLKIALEALWEGSLKAAKDKNHQKHDAAYLAYMNDLIPLIPGGNEINHVEPEGTVLHIGESHCLSFTNQIILIEGKRLTIKPRLIKGAKAWHFGCPGPNRFKQAFARRISQIDANVSQLLISFGEIDCREDEGIISHSLKNGKDAIEVSIATAESYINYIFAECCDLKTKIIIFGVPAPFSTTIDQSIEFSNRVAVIKSFNKLLYAKCINAGIRFADVYSLTKDELGVNNKKWMLDNIHLHPSSIQMLLANQ